MSWGTSGGCSSGSGQSIHELCIGGGGRQSVGGVQGGARGRDEGRGYIRAVAATMVGGGETLDEAVRKGEVKVIHQGGIKLYVFPKMTVSDKKSGIQASTSVRAKAVDTATHEVFSSLMDEMAWSITGVTPQALQDAAEQHTLPEEVVSKLSKSIADLDKAARTAQRQLDEAVARPTLSQFAKAVSQQLEGAIEAAELARDELRHLLKYRRARGSASSSPATLGEIQSAHLKAAEGLQNLLDLYKSLRALVPQKGRADEEL